MKCLILLALMTNMAFSRNHLSRRSGRTKTKGFELTIEVFDKILFKNPVYKVQADIVSSNTDYIVMSINREANTAKVPFFDKEGKLKLNKGLCTSQSEDGVLCYLRYGTKLALAKLQFPNELIEKEKGLFGEQAKFVRNTNINLITYEQEVKEISKYEVLRVQKDELACMNGLEKGKMDCNMLELYVSNGKSFFELLNETKINFQSFDENFGTKTAATKAIEAIKSDVESFKEHLKNEFTALDVNEYKELLINDTVTQSRLVEFEEQIVKKILAHFHIPRTNYKFYDNNVNQFFYLYTSEFYFKQTRRLMQMDNDPKMQIFDFVKQNILRKIHVNFDILNSFDQSSVITSVQEDFYAKLLFLREQFIVDKKMFSSIINQIEFMKWKFRIAPQ
jgi:hypothetical protein